MTPDGPQELRMNLPPSHIVLKREPFLPFQLAHTTRSSRSSSQHLQDLFNIHLPHAQTPESGLNGPGGLGMRDEDGPDLGDIVVKYLLLSGLFRRLLLS